MFNVAIASRLEDYVLFIIFSFSVLAAGREGSGVHGRILLCFRRILAFFLGLSLFHYWIDT